MQEKINLKDYKHEETDTAAISSKLNWLRAAVLGANDGIVSVAGLVVGVAGATTDRATILTAGIAGLVAGALSMAAGEFVSVSSQRDTEQALIDQEIKALEAHPDRELAELAFVYESKGLSKLTAKKVAEELTGHDAIRAHLDAEYGIDPDETPSASHAAIASAAAFTAGAIVPVLAILLPSASARVPVAFASVVVALTVTGILSAKVSKRDWLRPTVRVILGGAFAMIVTYGVGTLFSVHI